jgi:hypothetical protein
MQLRRGRAGSKRFPSVSVYERNFQNRNLHLSRRRLSAQLYRLAGLQLGGMGEVGSLRLQLNKPRCA